MVWSIMAPEGIPEWQQCYGGDGGESIENTRDRASDRRRPNRSRLGENVSAGAAQDLCLVEAGDAGDGGYHKTRQELHGGNIALVEGSGRRGQDLEDAQRAAVVTQR